jgi:hypothetical protein
MIAIEMRRLTADVLNVHDKTGVAGTGPVPCMTAIRLIVPCLPALDRSGARR